MNDILLSYGLFAGWKLCQEQSDITSEKVYQLNDNQRYSLDEMNEEHKNDFEDLEKINVFLYGSSGTGKSLLLPKLMCMRISYLLMKLKPKDDEKGPKSFSVF